ncbi:MAG: hypothetical protein C0602_02400 [Denitrovibrio sp.]|nr:MAG: hypothetical protein C0602_02400 [Denitrovibrio sp.]
MINDEKFKQLREKAEKKLAKISASLENVSNQSIEKLLHELNVHQVELEMQNDELRKSNHAYNESRNLFHKLYKNAPVSYIIVNNFGQIGMANDKFFETVGISEGEDIKRKSLTEYIHYEDINLFYSVFKAFYKNPDKHKFELRFMSNNKTVHTVISGYKYIEALNISKDMSGYDLLIVINDVTKIKELEEELSRKNKALEMMNETLQRRVEDEISQRLKHEQLLFEQKKFADMGEMLSSIAHQWRQPLNVLGLVLQSVYDSADKNLSDYKDTEELAKTGFEMITYLSETITDFRDFFRPTKEKAEFNVAHATLTALKLTQTQIEESGITLKFQCACDGEDLEPCSIEDPSECISDMPMVVGFKNEFKQVLMNLIYNARDSVKAYCEQGKALIKVSIENDENEIIIKIYDNGGGVPDELAEKIYDPYFTTKQDINGTGIGLYMCKTIVEKHFSGKLTHMNIDDGVSFKISIPKG